MSVCTHLPPLLTRGRRRLTSTRIHAYFRPLRIYSTLKESVGTGHHENATSVSSLSQSREIEKLTILERI